MGVQGSTTMGSPSTTMPTNVTLISTSSTTPSSGGEVNATVQGSTTMGSPSTTVPTNVTLISTSSTTPSSGGEVNGGLRHFGTPWTVVAAIFPVAAKFFLTRA